MAGALDTHCAEVHGQYVERGFGTALNGRCHKGCKAIHPLMSIARAALPENGLTMAVGSASTKRVSRPSH
mgnify:CR=1 FL=1